MCRAVEAQTAADHSKAGDHDELRSYLKAWLQKTSDVIGWWGVSLSFLQWNVVLILTETLRTIPCACMNGPGLLSNSGLVYTL